MLIGALAGNFGHANRTEYVNRGTVKTSVWLPDLGLSIQFEYEDRDIVIETTRRKDKTMGCSKGKPAPAKTGGGKKK